MSVKVFVLGRPGSGKTTAVRFIQALAERGKYPTLRVKDYDILRQMYLDDIELNAGNFRPAPCDGFDILNYSMFDLALQKLEEHVNAKSVTSKEIITIEFARNDYREALGIFTKEFLQDSYFLFLNAQLDVCKERILKRITHPPRPDYHFVSDYIMDNYYYQDNWDYIKNVFSKQPEYEDRVIMYQNTGELSDLQREVGIFFDSIVAKEFLSSIAQPASEPQTDLTALGLQPMQMLDIKAELPLLI
jgi:adenylate kinase family enzyme